MWRWCRNHLTTPEKFAVWTECGDMALIRFEIVNDLGLWVLNDFLRIGDNGSRGITENGSRR